MTKVGKSHLRCECGRAYPKRLIPRLFWTRDADSELMRLRGQGMTYNSIAKNLNERHGVRVNMDQVYSRHMLLCDAINASAPRRAVMAPPKPQKREPEPEPAAQQVMAAEAATKRHSNSCADPFCTKQRANGYDKCLAHLPPLEVGVFTHE